MDTGRRVTLRDVAAATGLSTATVSYALRGIHVPEETQLRVREAADRLGYQADPIARALASGRTGQVGVLCRSLEDIWQQDLAAALGRSFLEAGCPALIVDAGNDPDREATLLHRLGDLRVDAIVAIPVDPAGRHWHEVDERVALISIGDVLPGAACAAEVLFENTGVARAAMGRLADAGHRRVAVLSTLERSTPDRPIDRLVHQVADELGLEVSLHPTPYGIESSADIVESLLDGPQAPTAFFAIADTMAYGVYAAARRRGLSIPEDLSVLGLDGNEVSSVLSPPLSGFHWPLADVVDTAVARTIAAVAATTGSRRTGRPGRQPPHRTMFAASMVPGGSVAAPPGS